MKCQIMIRDCRNWVQKKGDHPNPHDPHDRDRGVRGQGSGSRMILNFDSYGRKWSGSRQKGRLELGRLGVDCSVGFGLHHLVHW